MRTWKLAAARAGDGSPLLAAKDYETAGTIEKRARDDADAAWRELGDERLQQVARRMFLLLSDVSADGQITRRRPPGRRGDGGRRGQPRRSRKGGARLQRDDRNFLPPPETVPLEAKSLVDVSHEALLRRWERFAKWLEEERRDAAELRRLAEQAQLRESWSGRRHSHAGSAEDPCLGETDVARLGATLRSGNDVSPGACAAEVGAACGRGFGSR